MGDQNTVPRRINKLEGAVGQKIRSMGPGVTEIWAYDPMGIMDFWSAGKEEVQLDAAGVTVALPDITVVDLPAGFVIVRAIVMFKFRMIENIYAGVNKLNGASAALASQVIQIRSDAPLAYVDGINFVDDFFTLADTVREGGDVIIGTLDVSGASGVDEEDTYNLRYLLGKADQDFINFNDVQVGLRIWYSV